MSTLSFGDISQFIRARRAGQTPASMLQARIDENQRAFAQRAREVADQALQRINQDQQTSESLNTMVEAARPTETAEAQLKKLKTMAEQLQSVCDEATKDLEKVQGDLEAQEKHKVAADGHFVQLREELGKHKETIPHLPFIYEAGSRASDSLNQRLNPKETSTLSVRRFLSEKASDDSQKPFFLLEARFAARKEQLERIHLNTQQRTNSHGSNLPELSERLQRLMASRSPCKENGNGAHWQI